MSLTGVVRLFVGTPHHPVGADGRMALSDHLRELRARILKGGGAIALAFVIALFFFDPIYDLVVDPYLSAQSQLPDGATEAVTNGPAGGFMLYLKLCGLASIIGSSPIWLYQIWAFILPGLHRHEKKWTAIFAAIAGPLFLVGIVLGYVTLPKGLEILIALNPDGVKNLVEFNEYLTFFSRTLVGFGIAFEIPVFVVLLNMAGIVKGKQLGAYRPWIIVGTFVLAAVITPSGDPFTMSAMAIPMVILFGISEVIARFNDRRRAKRGVNADLSPDEASQI